jgi:hypothetical protein
MEFLTVMHAYFRGEKLQAALFIAPVGLLFLAVAYGAWRSEHGSFLWATAVPSALVGLLLLATGISVAARASGQVAGIENGFTQNVAFVVHQELPRMRQVMVLFSRTIPTFGVMAVVGMGLRFGIPRDWAMALGAVLVAAGGAGLVIDGFAKRRAEVYVVALEKLATQHSVNIEPKTP